MGMGPPGIAVVTRPTRLEGLRQRWGTAGQAKFLLKQAHVQEAARRQEAAAPQSNASQGAGARKRAAAGKRNQAAVEEVLPAAAAYATFSDYEEEAETYDAVVERLEKELDFGLPVRIVPRQFVPTFEFGYFAAVVVVGQDGLVANVAFKPLTDKNHFPTPPRSRKRGKHNQGGTS